jgi:hypothetical protein
VDGIESVIVDTEFSSMKVSLNDVKHVADARNWDDNYHSFFCNMEPKGRRPDNWLKVLETVGFCDIPGSRSLRTMLKYYKSEKDGPDSFEARLDFDLNDPIPDSEGDGLITVDRGYINMFALGGDPAKPGVSVRSRKVAHINGIRPYTQKRFVCLFGYAYAAMDMLFGSALDPPKNVRPWKDPPEEQPQAKPSSTSAPAQSSNSVASTAIKMMAECAQDLSTRNLDLYDKWLSGQLTSADLADYSAEVSARIASDPWKFMQAISRPNGGGT